MTRDAFDDFLYIWSQNGGFYCGDCQELVDVEQAFSLHELDGGDVEALCGPCADQRLELQIQAGRLFECDQCGITQGIEELSRQDPGGQYCVSCDADRLEHEVAWELYCAQRQPVIRQQWYEVAKALGVEVAVIMTADGTELHDLEDVGNEAPDAWPGDDWGH